MKEYTDNQLLEMLYTVWEEKGSIKCEDFRPVNGLPHYQVISKRFGSWENAKEKAGIKQNNRRMKYLSKQEIIEEFNRVCTKIGEVPSQSNFVKHSGRVNGDMIRKVVGSYEDLISSSELKSNKYRSAYKKEFLLSEINRFVREFKRVPIPTDFENLESYPARKTFYNHFGTFEDALLKAGHTPTYIGEWDKISIEDRQKYVEEIVMKVYHEKNIIPTIGMLADNTDGTIGRSFIRSAFGSYGNLLNKCGLVSASIKVNGRYTDEYLKNEFDRFVKLNGRIPQIQEFNNSEYPSFWCYQNRFGSWNKAVKHYGYEPTYTNRRYVLANGEECDSLYELTISEWLQSNNVSYTRNIPYREICNNYNGKMNCDYKININGVCIFVEMAGFLPRSKVEWDKFSVEEKNYARKMKYKKKIMDRENILYYIIYPDEINTHSVQEIYQKIKDKVEALK